MDLPRKVQICGKTYTVRKNRKLWNSQGSTGIRKIVIGTRWNSDEHELDHYIHEVAEIVCCERNVRYLADFDDQSLFVMSHREFSDVMSDVATAIRPMILRGLR